MFDKRTRALLEKDWRLISTPFMSYAALGAVFVAAQMIPGTTASIVSSILVVTVFVAFYSHVSIKSIVTERKMNNHLFLMTLPVSAKHLYFAKMLANWLLFSALWFFLLVLVAAIVVGSDRIPAMLLTLYIFMFLIFIPAFAIISGTALISGSEGWTILVFVLCNTVVTVAINMVSNNTEVQQTFRLGTFTEVGLVWPSWALQYCIWLLAIALAVVAVTTVAGFARTEFR